MKTQQGISQLDNILSDPPIVHKGGATIFGLGEDVIRYIDDTLKPGAKTLETGAGLSTILFALRSSEHTCITPSEEEVNLIRAYCLRKNISLEHVHFIIDFSQNVLPIIDRVGLNLVLIDGGHGYPVPAIDWFYTAPMLEVGGVVVIDDVQLWTVLELKRFLAEEDAWKLVQTFARSIIYEKMEQEYAREWISQPYIFRKSRFPRFLNQLQGALRLLLRGDFSNFVNNLRKQLAIR